ncbi:MAG TPA: ribonuclease III [Kofleriaceae bacterium]|nr:ribonuclease III [Kofleriaceae bacterium]
MPGPDDFSGLEAVLGYSFRDRGLLEQALRHASWCNEQNRDAGGKLGDNQRLEFLGDAVLSLTVSQRLMSRFPEAHEGDLSVTRAQVVSEEGLSDVAGKLGFGDWILLGKGEEKSGGRAKPKILADAFEAIVAAVYLDGGFQAAWDLVERLLTERINAAEIKNFYDFKTRLQETSQARLKATPTYRVVQELGPDHDKRFVVAVTIGTDEWARAVGKSKKEAEQMAAAEAHFRLEGSDVGVRPKR